MIGRVIFFDVKKGYGFIWPDDQGLRVFFHQDALHCVVNSGDQVAYTLDDRTPAPRALSVRPVEFA